MLTWGRGRDESPDEHRLYPEDLSRPCDRVCPLPREKGELISPVKSSNLDRDTIRFALI